MRNKTKVHNTNTAPIYKAILEPNRSRCWKKSRRREILSGVSGASCDHHGYRRGCYGHYDYQRKDHLGQQKLRSQRCGKSHVRYHDRHFRASYASSLSSSYHAYCPRHSHLSRRLQVLRSCRGDRHQACDQRKPPQHHRGVWNQGHALHQLDHQVRLADHIGQAVALHNRVQEELRTAAAQEDMASVHGFHHTVLLGAGRSHLAVEDRRRVRPEVVTGKGSVMGEDIDPVEEDRDYLHTDHDRHKGVVLGALHVDCTDRIHRSPAAAAAEVDCSHHRNTLVQTC